MRKWVGMNKNTIVDWFNLCREVCTLYMDLIDTENIGGVGKVVKIDESKFGKNNNNNKGEEEKDRGFWEAWREVVTKYLCKSFHRVMRRRFYQ